MTSRNLNSRPTDGGYWAYLGWHPLFRSPALSERAFRLLRWIGNRPEPQAPAPGQLGADGMHERRRRYARAAPPRSAEAAVIGFPAKEAAPPQAPLMGTERAPELPASLTVAVYGVGTAPGTVVKSESTHEPVSTETER